MNICPQAVPGGRYPCEADPDPQCKDKAGACQERRRGLPLAHHPPPCPWRALGRHHLGEEKQCLGGITDHVGQEPACASYRPCSCIPNSFFLHGWSQSWDLHLQQRQAYYRQCVKSHRSLLDILISTMAWDVPVWEAGLPWVGSGEAESGGR